MIKMMIKSKLNKVLVKLADNNTRLTEREFLTRDGQKTGHKFLAIEKFTNYIDRQVSNIQRISDEIAMKNKLLNSTSIENYLLSATGTKTSADKQDSDSEK